MLLIHGNAEGWHELEEWPAEDLQAMFAFMHGINRDLEASGELLDAQGLAGPEQAKTVRAGEDGEPVVTDGPFSETKEVLAGYWLIDVPTQERALEIAARISATPGPGGILINQPVEVHPIGQAPEV
ncbi:MAG TPA: YciI family protein [Kribbella sp.]|nr:YciI family protein [Kribbella sp.]